MIKEIIFDCFGVLTQDGWSAFIKRYANQSMMDDLHKVNELADTGKISYQEFLLKVSEITKVDTSITHQIISANLLPNEEVFNLAKKLSDKYTLGIISNVGAPLEGYFPEHYLDIFAEKTCSYQEGFIKPSKEIFNIHLGRTGFDPDEVVFIDDREVNCQGAKRAGLQAVWFKNIDQLTHDLKKIDVKI